MLRLVILELIIGKPLPKSLISIIFTRNSQEVLANLPGLLDILNLLSLKMIKNQNVSLLAKLQVPIFLQNILLQLKKPFTN